MLRKNEGIGGLNPNKNPHYPYDRDTTRGAPNLDSAPSMHIDEPKKVMKQASCTICGMDFALYEEGTKAPEYCHNHSWMAGVFFPDSSNVKAVGWMEQKLYVQFTTEDWYEFSNVPELIFNILHAAHENKQSVGSAFHTHVKYKYPYKKIKFDHPHQSTIGRPPSPPARVNVDATQPQDRGILAGKGVVNAVSTNSQQKRGVS